MGRIKVKLTEIVHTHPEMDYVQLYEYICNQINTGILTPVKASGLNGKKPALYNSYWKSQEEKDYTEVYEELRYRLSPLLDTTYYQKNPQKYMEDGKYVCLLSEYLMKNKELLETPVTINERSFQIFHREKFLDRENGRKLLTHLGVCPETLNFYETSEPMSYYSHKKQTPQNFLIIENKDTFYSMRKHLIHSSDNILGLSVGTLIYGGGKSIYKSFDDFVNCVEPYFAHKQNKVYYFGDLDYEGILIYEHLQKQYEKQTEILLFTKAYEKMVKKAKDIGCRELPDSKDGQNKNAGAEFLQNFSTDMQIEIKKVLETGKYIPQEILNESDY